MKNAVVWFESNKNNSEFAESFHAEIYSDGDILLEFEDYCVHRVNIEIIKTILEKAKEHITIAEKIKAEIKAEERWLLE